MKSFFITIVVAAIFFLAFIFGARNEQMVTISYFVAQGEYRLPIVLASVFLGGFVLSWLCAAYQIIKLKVSLRQANKKLAALEPKVTSEEER
ncbi:LapA family protein [Parashewanella tropica]|uniref:LapA family protein n=1 Tax=Parashewanella tropica TaxID=2547970 RepID=UPI001059D54D|nr:lipopolysaccharide assembly protein LapA domain-containing protein [Parashewanella tropica]